MPARDPEVGQKGGHGWMEIFNEIHQRGGMIINLP